SLAILNGPGRQVNNCLPSQLVASSVDRVSCHHDHVNPVTGNTAVSPNSAADGCRRPSHHTRRIVDVHAHNPAVVILAVTHVSGIGDVNDTVHESQCTAFFLD